MRFTIKNPLFWGWLFFALFLPYGTLIPFDFARPQENAAEILENFFSLQHLIERQPVSKMDVLSNTLLFIPFGFFSAGLLLRGRSGVFGALFFGALGCFLYSFALEIAQAFSPSRVSSVGDVILNTLSGALGALAGTVYFLFFREPAQLRWRQWMEEKPFAVATLLLGAALFLGGLIPFDFSLQISDLKTAVKTIQWVPFSPPAATSAYYFNLAADGALLAFFAMLCHFSLRLYSLVLPSFFVSTLFLTLMLAGTIEFAQLFVVSRTTDTTHLALALIAGTAGSWVAAWGERRVLKSAFSAEAPFSFYLKLMGAFFLGAGAAYLLLAPLEFLFSFETARGNASWGQLVPLYAYWVRTDFYAVQDLVKTAAIFAVLGGYLFSCFRPFPFSRGAALLLCLFLSAGVELLQFFQPGRYPDVTDLLSALAGAAAGIWGTKKLFP